MLKNKLKEIKKYSLTQSKIRVGSGVRKWNNGKDLKYGNDEKEARCLAKELPVKWMNKTKQTKQTNEIETETAQYSTGAIVLKRIVVFSISFMCGFRHDLIYYTIYKQFIIMRAYYHLAFILPCTLRWIQISNRHKKKYVKTQK